MADFMLDHSDFAKNRIPNTALGKTTSNRLWDQLTVKLNASGPPIKNCISWRKVFAHQKHQVKLKLSKNKASKRKTGGGPCQEIVITPIDQNIIEAAGLTAAVEGLSSVKTFGSTSKAITAQLKVKHKSSTHKADKKKFSGGVCRELHLNTAEKNIMEATVLNATKERLSSTKSFGISSAEKQDSISQKLSAWLQTESDNECNSASLISESSSMTKSSDNAMESNCSQERSSNVVNSGPRKRSITKLSLLEKNLKKNADWRKEKKAYYQKMIELKEKSLKMKKDEHISNMAIKEVDLQIKTLQLEMRKKSSIETYNA